MSPITDKVLKTKIIETIKNTVNPTLTPVSRLGKGDVLGHAHLNKPTEKVEAMKELVGERGMGTFLDIPVNVARMFPSVKKLLPDDKYKNLLYSYQSRVANADKAIGESLAAKGGLLKKIFTTTDMSPDVKVVTEKGNLVQAFVPTESARLSAPLDKTKNFVIPILTMYGIDKVINDSKKDKTAALRDMMIEKIAAVITKSNMDKLAVEKMTKASTLLKQASDKINQLESDCERLATEVSDLKKQIFAKERSRKATKLAQDMVVKGLIKQASLTSQIDYIMGLDEEGFKVLNKTVGDVPIKKASQDGLDKVSYLIEENTQEASTLEDAILRIK